jgi:glycosyltransferase involved in cell wall biosynthesis
MDPVLRRINPTTAFGRRKKQPRRLLYAASNRRMTRLTRIAVLNSHPIQYFAPLYAYLNAAPDLNVTALYLSDISIRGAKDAGFGRVVKWDLDLLAGYQSVFLGERARTREPGGFWSLVAPQVWNELRSGRYDVVWLHGHNYAANLIAFMAAKSVGLHVLMRGETHLGLPCNGVKSLLRRPVMGALYRSCDRLLAIGSANATFYQAMGVPDSKIFLVPYSVDNERFVERANLTSDEKKDVRERYHVPTDRPSVLFAAKFTRRKRPGDVLQAALRLRMKTSHPFTVVMAGSGELESELRSFCASHALNNVVFTGFVNQSQLPALYAASDVFVLPSENEPWGLAVNEAMCASVPVVVAREVGCVPDLVRDGVNGYTPATGDIDGLAHAFQHLIEDEDLRRRQGQASLERIRQWDYRQCLEGIRSALAGLPFPRTEVSTLRTRRVDWKRH